MDGGKSSASVSKQRKNHEENSLALVIDPIDPIPLAAQAPIVASYKDRIRPLLDCIDRLRRLKITDEGIQLPTIVVVGDQSSGKSSVLESLAAISLPRAQGICTRVPLIMRLQHHPSSTPELYLEYKNKTVHTNEVDINEAICHATNEIAGSGKGISDSPLTLVVKKNGVPDLTMVDLPGITRVPVHGQPENIYEQISSIIMEYIRPEESIILNVLSASVDFTTCESIRMSQIVDKTGERTLAVVTKADRSPEGLLEKVTADDVNIGLGYVCVRNRIGDETYEEARIEEDKLFECHPLLSKIDKSIVGVPTLAQKLVQIQATIIARCLPEIIKKINERLNESVSEMKKIPKNMTSVPEAIAAFMQIIGSSKESLMKILVRGEFEEYPDEEQMHCTARLADMLHKFSSDLHSSLSVSSKRSFMEEIKILEETKSIALPNFLPRSAFLLLLQRHVNAIAIKPVDFVCDVWDYIEIVVLKVLMYQSENYPQLQTSIRRAAQNFLIKMKDQSVKRVVEIVEMEKLSDYTCNPEYLSEWNKLMTHQEQFTKEVMNDERWTNTINLIGYGEVDVSGLRDYHQLLHQAFDLKMRMTAYWKLVLRRIVDSMAMYMLFTISNIVKKGMDVEIINELMSPTGGGIERMLEESPFVAGKREKLNRSIALLRESKDVVSKVMDNIVSYGCH